MELSSIVSVGKEYHVGFKEKVKILSMYKILMLN